MKKAAMTIITMFITMIAIQAQDIVVVRNNFSISKPCREMQNDKGKKFTVENATIEVKNTHIDITGEDFIQISYKVNGEECYYKQTDRFKLVFSTYNGRSVYSVMGQNGDDYTTYFIMIENEDKTWDCSFVAR